MDSEREQQNSMETKCFNMENQKQTIESFIAEWDAVEKIKIFEIPVIRNNEQDYIIFDIEIKDGKFRAEHEALNEAEETSNKIAFIEHEINLDCSLDVNLQELYNDCVQKLIDNNIELSE